MWYIPESKHTVRIPGKVKKEMLRIVLINYIILNERIISMWSLKMIIQFWCVPPHPMTFFHPACVLDVTTTRR